MIHVIGRHLILRDSTDEKHTVIIDKTGADCSFRKQLPQWKTRYGTKLSKLQDMVNKRGRYAGK